MLRHIEAYSGIDAHWVIFRHIRNYCVTLEYMTAIFKTLAHLEPQASSKACQTCKMVRHIQSPDIEWLIQAFSRLIRDIQGCWCIFSHIYRHPTREEAKPPLLYFLKFEKDALILEKKGLDCVHLWVKFSIQNVVQEYLGEKASKMFSAEPFFVVLLMKCLLKCSSSMKPPLPWKISGFVSARRHYSFCKTLHRKCLTVFWICLSW